MIEVWKDVVGYEGLYQVSNNGKIKSLDRFSVRNFGIHKNCKIKNKGKLLKTESRLSKGKGLEFGYARCSLRKNGVSKNYCVHRLVAEAFIPNPENKQHVDHIDTNTLNNSVYNLRWVTAVENSRNEITRRRFKEVHNIKVRELVSGKTFESISEAASYFKINRVILSRNMKNNRPTKGLTFVKVEE
jgi:hypothetical protein